MFRVYDTCIDDNDRPYFKTHNTYTEEEIILAGGKIRVIPQVDCAKVHIDQDAVVPGTTAGVITLEEGKPVEIHLAKPEGYKIQLDGYRLQLIIS